MSLGAFASAALSFWNALFCPPPTKVPIDGLVFATYVLPPVICHFAAALLVVTPHTRVVRISLCPPTALLALRAALSVDVSLGKTELKFFNVLLVAFMFSVALRALEWSLVKEPLVRHLRPANSTPSTIMDTFDLISNLRGHGWEWSRGLHVPLETRPMDRNSFASHTLFSAATHALMAGVLQTVMAQQLPPVGMASIAGPGAATLFDPSLAFPARCLRAGTLTVLSALSAYAVLQTGYDLTTLFGVLVLRQDPAQWPPMFDAPWRAMSLSEFWARRWHQLPRRLFLVLGGYPLALVLGRTPGTVIGAFLASALLHHIAMVTIDSRMHFGWMLVGFGMMALGVLAERAYRGVTGKRVGGVVGWVWTMGWLILWGSVIMEGSARAGMLGCVSFE